MAKYDGVLANVTQSDILPDKEPSLIDQTNSQGMEMEANPAKRMVQQVFFEFYHKPTKPKRTILASSANPWQQKRTTLTQEMIRRLRNTRKEINCTRKQEIISEYMQMLKNSGYSARFRKEILLSGINGYNKILEADRSKQKPLYRPKDWKRSSRWMDSRQKAKNGLELALNLAFLSPQHLVVSSRNFYSKKRRK